MSEMTVDVAIAYALVIREAENERDLALVTLAAEVKRLRAGVEAVRGLPWCYGHHHDGLIDRDDVLAALGVTDD